MYGNDAITKGTTQERSARFENGVEKMPIALADYVSFKKVIWKLFWRKTVDKQDGNNRKDAVQRPSLTPSNPLDMDKRLGRGYLMSFLISARNCDLTLHLNILPTTKRHATTMRDFRIELSQAVRSGVYTSIGARDWNGWFQEKAKVKGPTRSQFKKGYALHCQDLIYWESFSAVIDRQVYLVQLHRVKQAV